MSSNAGSGRQVAPASNYCLIRRGETHRSAVQLWKLQPWNSPIIASGNPKPQISPKEGRASDITGQQSRQLLAGGAKGTEGRSIIALQHAR